TNETEGIGLKASLLAGVRELQGAHSMRQRVLGATVQEIDFAQIAEQACVIHRWPGGSLSKRLLQQGQCVAHPPGQRIRIAQLCSYDGKPPRDLPRLAQV